MIDFCDVKLRKCCERFRFPAKLLRLLNHSEKTFRQAQSASRLSISLFTVRHGFHSISEKKERPRRKNNSRRERRKEVERDKNFLINFIEYHTLFMTAEELSLVEGIYEITYELRYNG